MGGRLVRRGIVQPQVAEPRPTSNRITSYTTTFLLALEIGLISQDHDGLAQDASLE